MSVLERKNVRGLVRAFEAAFREDDDCYLVLKVNSTRRSSYEFDMVCGEVTSPRVLVVEGVLNRLDTFAFLKSLDVYVSLHRSEGFGLTCAESMACGIPVIASGYSGNLDFMSSDNSLLVPTSVIETDRPFGPYPTGTRWGEPHHDAATQAMRTLLCGDERERLAAAGAHSVRQTLGPSAVSRRLRQLLSMQSDRVATVA
jgi:glycosyltransferase involved in cell wall biosynthesis